MALIRVRLQPRASSSRITGEKDGVIQVRVTAPPVDGEANAALEKLVAKKLGIAKSKVEVVKGETSREKLLEIDGLGEADARRMLLA